MYTVFMFIVMSYFRLHMEQTEIEHLKLGNYIKLRFFALACCLQWQLLTSEACNFPSRDVCREY
jgi:hypothetical protein